MNHQSDQVPHPATLHEQARELRRGQAVELLHGARTEAEVAEARVQIVVEHELLLGDRPEIWPGFPLGRVARRG